jgi:hypothetical protein
VARFDAIGNTRTMTAIPQATIYHRWAGWHAPAMRRAIVVACIGLAVGIVLMRFAPWELAVVAGWDAAALTFLMSLWPIIIRADSSQAAGLQLCAPRGIRTPNLQTRSLALTSIWSVQTDLGSSRRAPRRSRRIHKEPVGSSG